MILLLTWEYTDTRDDGPRSQGDVALQLVQLLSVHEGDTKTFRHGKIRSFAWAFVRLSRFPSVRQSVEMSFRDVRAVPSNVHLLRVAIRRNGGFLAMEKGFAVTCPCHHELEQAFAHPPEVQRQRR
jgi:hypothetical protein